MRFKTYNEKGRGRCPDWKRFKGSPAKHYETMSLDDIKALPVGDYAAPDSALLLWAVWPLLPEALAVMRCWGFTYKTAAFVWGKTTRAGRPAIGMGYYTRSASEVCLLGIRGNVKRLSKSVRQLIIEPRREHSRKPDRIHTDIEQLFPGPYLELFARQQRPGWTCVGDQVDRIQRNGGLP